MRAKDRIVIGNSLPCGINLAKRLVVVERQISRRPDHEIVVDRIGGSVIPVLVRDPSGWFAAKNRRRGYFDERFVGREIVERIREEIRAV